MEKKIALLILTPMLLFWHWFEPVPRKNNAGINAYKKGEYNRALEKFLSAKGMNPDSNLLKNNTALTLYNLKKYEKALNEFSKVDPKKLGMKSSDFYYNLGDSYFRLKKFKKALDSFKKSLLLNPTDINAKKNFEITLKKLNEQKKKKDKNKKNKNKKNDSDKKNSKEKIKKEKYKGILKYLNRKEKEQMKKKKRKVQNKKNEKDW